MHEHHDTVKAPRRDIVREQVLLGSVEVDFSTDQLRAGLHDYLLSVLVSIFVMSCGQVLALYLLLGKTIIASIKAIKRYASRITPETTVLPESPRTLFTRELDSLQHSIVAMVTALLNSESGYRSIFENSLEGIFQTSLAGRFLKVNPALAEILGYDSPASVVKSISNIAEQLYYDRTERQGILEIIAEKGCITRREVVFRHRDGHPVYNLISIYAVRNEQGEIDHLQGSLIDISERKRAEEQLASLNQNLESLVAERTEELHQRNALLRAGEERYRTLVETMQEGLLTVDRQGVLTFVNQQMSAMLGLQPVDMIGKNCLDFIDVACRNRFTAGLVVTKDVSAERFEIVFSGSDGHGVHTLVSPTPLYDGFDCYNGAFAVVTNISILKELQTQLLHAQKLESIGQLAAGIAHEINTPTQYVINNIRFLQDAFAEIGEMLVAYEHFFAAMQEGRTVGDSRQSVLAMRDRLQQESLMQEVAAAFHDTVEGIERISRIVGSVKTFAHPGQDRNLPADLNEAIRSTIIVSTNEWKYVADIETDLDPTLPLVPCNISAINQVVLNLIVNAAHAIEESSEGGGRGKGRIHIASKGLGDFAEIRVRDSGSGIPENIRNRIFDPFFTTKEVGKGTGQGLAIARTIICETHRGSITFDTETGRGTTFIILLPLAETGASLSPPTAV